MAIKANLIIDQGSTYSTVLNLTDDDDAIIDLTGYTGAAQIRKHYTSSANTPFTVSISPLDGAVTLSLTATQTANLVAGRYVYDVELTSASNVVSRVVEGIVTVTPQVTR
jgi:hypothetical protein